MPTERSRRTRQPAERLLVVPRSLVRIAPTDVGERVTLRARHSVPGEPPETEAIGYLRRWSDGRLEIERKDGSVLVVDEGDLLAGRVVGPPPVRRRGRLDSG
jgi:hypothetical protein